MRIGLVLKGIAVWWQQMTNDLRNLLSKEATQPSGANWWDDLTEYIGSILSPFLVTLPAADTTAMTKALNDLQQAITAMQNPAPQPQEKG